MITIVAGVALGWCGVVSQQGRKHHFAPQRTPIAIAVGSQGALEHAIKRDVMRPVYPFSIIQGGVFSADEVIHALKSDPIAASHYRVFQLDHLRAVKSTFALPVYLSYRKDNLIFWTKHRIYLREGETLLTDGSSYARARCGNRVSVVPQEPVGKAEPPPEVFDRPELGAILQPLLQAAVDFETKSTAFPIGRNAFASQESRWMGIDDTPEGIDLAGMVLPEVSSIVATPYPLPDGHPPFTTGSTPADWQPVPEPSELVLTGLAAIALVFLRKQQRHARN